MAKAKPHRRWIWVMFAVLFLLFLTPLVIVASLHFRSGVRVTVRNTGTQPMRMVSLEVTGHSYPLGDLAPVATATAIVNPSGESGVDIVFTDVNGKKQSMGGGYIEPGYGGTIAMSINDGAIEKFDDQSRL